MTNITNILSLLHLAEKLKFELRHSYTSSGRQESVAEHTWRMALMAILLEPYLDQKIDVAKTLKMIIIHDLVEAEAGDVPYPRMVQNPELKKIKEEKEKVAIEKIRTMLNNSVGDEIHSLWNEFEVHETYEAKVALALDKLEVQIQHNEADFKTWEPIEYELIYSRRPYTDFDSTINRLREIIEKDAEEKLKQAGIDIESIKSKVLSPPH
ncbi:MAG: HD domain-containing protein [Ignavibacteriales bacterium]|nr:HD domain-containing protein [Ignavibacteriales bacterium]